MSTNDPATDASGQKIMTVRLAAKDITCGSIAGTTSAVFKYPFDLAKVRLQSQLLSPVGTNGVRYRGPVDCLVKTYRAEGFRGLYRGLPAPIVGSMTETATLFLSYSAFQNLIRSYTTTGYDTPPNTPLSIPQTALASACAGFVTSFLLTPIDLVKCKMQVQMINTSSQAYSPASHQPITAPVTTSSFPTITTYPVKPLPPINAQGSALAFSSLSTTTIQTRQQRPPPGPIDLIKSIVRTHGLKGLWVGHTGMMLLETIGAGGWFTVKEGVSRVLKERRARQQGLTGIGGMTLLPWESAVAGAVAGAACISVLYPVDTIKSVMQTEEEVRKGSRVGTVGTGGRGFWEVLKRMYRMHGVRGLYSGCGMTVARVVPSSGIVFVVYDGLSVWMA